MFKIFSLASCSIIVTAIGKNQNLQIYPPPGLCNPSYALEGYNNNIMSTTVTVIPNMNTHPAMGGVQQRSCACWFLLWTLAASAVARATTKGNGKNKTSFMLH